VFLEKLFTPENIWKYVLNDCILNDLPLYIPYDPVGFEVVAVRSVYEEVAVSLLLSVCLLLYRWIKYRGKNLRSVCERVKYVSSYTSKSTS